LLELSLLEQSLRQERGERTTAVDLLTQAPELSQLLLALVETQSDLGAGFDAAPPTVGIGESVSPAPEKPTLPLGSDPTGLLLGQTVSSPDAGTPPGWNAKTIAKVVDPRVTKLAGEPFGRYQLLEKRGEGGMGVVYRAWDPKLERYVALKIIKAGVFADGTHLRHFKSEVEVIASLDHPGIVPLYEEDEHDRVRYYTMKLIEGTTLKERPRAVNDARAAATLMIEIARAVQHVHERGVLHRDLKPSNVLIDELGRPHLIDFGLAKRVDRATEFSLPSGVVGTPGYISPEQIQPDTRYVSTSTDVYGLGGILYHLLTGKAPFETPSLPAMFRLILEVDPKSPRAYDPSIDRDLELICLKCLRKSSADRYPSAQSLAEDLECWLEGKPISARPFSPPERAWKWARRRPAVAAASAIAIGALLLGSGGAAWQFREAVIARGNFHRAMLFAQQNEQVARDGEDLANHEAYIAQILLAGNSWEDSNLRQVGRLLEATRPVLGKRDFRGLEWSYLFRAMHRERAPLAGNEASILDLAYLPPNGAMILTLGSDHTFRLCDATTGQLVRVVATHASPVLSIDVLPDGKSFVSCGPDRRVSHWDLATGQPIRQFELAPALLREVAVSPDGLRVAAASFDGKVRIWEISGGPAVRTIEFPAGSWPLSLAYSPDGHTLAIGGNLAQTQLWDLVDTTAAPRIFQGPTPHVLDLAFRPDGTQLLAAHVDGPCVLWDVATAQPVHTINAHRSSTYAVAFTSDGKRFATAGVDQAIGLWNTESGERTNLIRAHSGAISSLAFSPDGGTLASGGLDQSGKLWDPLVRQEVNPLHAHTGEIFAVQFAAQGNWLASAGTDGIIRIWDPSRSDPLRAIPGQAGTITALAISRDGTHIATGGQDGSIRIWEAATGNLVHTLAGHQGRVLGLAFHPDGRTLASGGADRDVRLWDLIAGGAPQLLQGHTDNVSDLVYSQDGSRLASVGDDNRAILWNFETRRPLRELEGHGPNLRGVLTLAFSPDGQTLFTGGWDQVILQWNLTTGTIERRLEGHNDGVTRLVVTPDGRRLLSSSNERFIRVWDLELGKELLRLDAGTGPLNSVSLSADGRWLAASGHSPDVLVWDLGSLAAEE
jgi:WD40 repeat protein